jgi:hypothetical protein
VDLENRTGDCGDVLLGFEAVDHQETDRHPRIVVLGDVDQRGERGT